MHFPVLIHLGPLSLHPHLVFELLAYFAGARLFMLLRRRKGDVVGDEVRLVLIIAAAGGALLGSKLLGLLDTAPFWEASSYSWRALAGSKTILGGILGGALAVEITKYIRGISTSTGDLLVFPLIAAIAIGRIGCFLTGLEDGTFGSPSTGWWAVDFGDGIPRHPTALYEICFLAALGGALCLLSPQLARRNGLAFKLFVIAYCLFRLCADALKPTYKILFGLSAIQIASLLGAASYLILLLRGGPARVRFPKEA